MGLPANCIAKLKGVHPNLVAVIMATADVCPQPFIVVQGVRTISEMYVNWGKGRTVLQCQAAGVPIKYAQPQMDKVTWLRDPTKSNHRIMPDGYGHAVDLGALVHGAYDGQHEEPYNVIAKTVMETAAKMKTHLRWGADWNENGVPHERGETDLGHWELVV